MHDSLSLDINSIASSLDIDENLKLSISPKGNKICSSDYLGNLKIYKFDNNHFNLLYTITNHYSGIKIQKFITENILLILDNSNKCFLYNLNKNYSVKSALKFNDFNQKIKDIDFNKEKSQIDLLLQDGSLISYDLNSRNHKCYKKLFLKNGNKVIIDNNDNFACSKDELENIYFVEKIKLLKIVFCSKTFTNQNY